jgi:aerobic C4-dicarboxylate transport protein
MLLTSKGAAGVAGGGFIALTATLSTLGTVPAAAIMLIFGIDKFMSECRALVNFYGNAMATLVVAKWNKTLDVDQARRVLAGHAAPDLSTAVDEEAIDDRTDGATSALAGPVVPHAGRPLPVGAEQSASVTASEPLDGTGRIRVPATR